MPKDEAEKAAKKALKEKKRAEAAAAIANVASMSDVEMAMGDVTVGGDDKVGFHCNELPTERGDAHDDSPCFRVLRRLLLSYPSRR